MACLALVSVLVYFHIAVRSRAYVITVAGAALEIVLIALFHDSGQEIAAVALAVGFLVALPPVPGRELDLPLASSVYEPCAESAAGIPSLWQPASLELSVVLPCHNAAPGLQGRPRAGCSTGSQDGQLLRDHRRLRRQHRRDRRDRRVARRRAPCG